MTIGRRPIVLAVCLVLALGVLTLSYLLAFHLDSLQGLVREQFVRAFGPSVQIGQIHASFFPPQLELVDVYLKEAGATDPFFHASRLRWDLTFFSFLQEHMESEGLVVEQPTLRLMRDQTGQWNIPKAWTSREKEHAVFGVWLSPFRLNIIDGQIVIIDVFERDRPESLMVKGLQMQMVNSSSQSPVDFSLSARLAHNQNESPVAVYGNLDDYSKVLDWLDGAALASFPSMAIHGRAAIGQSELRQLSKLLNRDALPFEFDGTLELQGQMRMGPSKNGYQLVLSEMAIETNAISLKGDASFAGLFESEPPTISVNWSGTPIDLAVIVDHLPNDVLPSEFVDAVSRGVVGGKIEVVSATLSGSFREEVGLSLIGEVHVTEGLLDLGDAWGTATQVTGTLKVEPDQIRLFDFQGTYDSIAVTSGTGVIEFRETGPWLTSELQGDVPIVKLINIIRQVFDWQTPHTLSTLRGLEGSGPMRVRFAGPLQPIKAVAFQHASYFPQSVSLYVPGLAKPLTNVTGNLTISTSQVNFEQVRAHWRHSELGIHGAIQFQDRKYYDDIQVQGRLQGEDVFEWLGSDLYVRGPSLFEGMVSGSLHAPRVAVSLDAEGTTIAVPGILKKVAGVSGALDVELSVTQGEVLSVERVGLALPTLRAAGKGSFPISSHKPFSAAMVIEPITLSTLSPGVSILDGALKAGTVEISLNVEGEREDWRGWKKNGWVALSNGRLELEGIQAPVNDLMLRVKLQDHKAEVKRLEFRLVKSLGRIEGVVDKWETTPVVTLSADGQQFDLDLLIPKGQRSPVREFLEQVASTMQVSGHLSFKDAYYKELRFPNLSGKLRIQEEIIGVGQIVGNMDQGELKGRFLVHLPVKKAATVKTWVNLVDAPIEVLERSFLKPDDLQERMLTGILSLDGMLEGNGKSEGGAIGSLQGTLKCTIRDGRIQRGTVVPKLLTLMNLPNLLRGKVDLNKNGYPFDTQSATLEINQGVFTSKDIVMNGPILKMTAAGKYDAVQDNLDVVAAVSPLGPYFDLLKKVSLFRMLLEGDEKGLEMAFFEVKGSLHNPQVQALPVKSLTSGLTGFAELAFRVLKNTVMLPTKILFPEDKRLPGVSGQGEGKKKADQTEGEGGE